MMKLINLTEYRRNENTGQIEEQPLLLNPEAIETIQRGKMQEKDEAEIPIIGEDRQERWGSGITLRSNRKHLVKEDLNTILVKCRTGLGE